MSEAIALAQEALDEKRAGGADLFTLAITLGTLGTHLEAVDEAEALRRFKEATALLEQTDAVRDLAESHADEARVLHSMGRMDDARDAAQHSLEVAATDPDAWSECSSAHVALANLAEDTELPAALNHARSAVREAESCNLITRTLAIALSARGRLRGHLGESAEAVADLRASCKAFRDAEGESPDYALSLGNLGVALVMLGGASDSTQVAGEGLAVMRRSRELLLAAYGPGHPSSQRASVMLEQAHAKVLGIS